MTTPRETTTSSGAGRRGVSIRRSLVRNLVLLIVITAGAILGLTVVQSSQAVEDLSRSLVNRSTRQVEAELRGFFDPVRHQLHRMRDWGEGGLLPVERDALTPLLLPVLRRPPQVRSLMVADPEGHGYMLLEQPDEFRARMVWADRWGRTARWTHYDPRGVLASEREEDLGYDPRTRPWYTQGLAAHGEIAWTEPYTFFTTHEPGITASMTYRPRGSEHTHVAALLDQDHRQ